MNEPRNFHDGTSVSFCENGKTTNTDGIMQGYLGLAIYTLGSCLHIHYEEWQKQNDKRDVSNGFDMNESPYLQSL